MSTVDTLTKLATDAVGKAAHAVTHPVSTVTTVAGQARRVAASVVGGGHHHQPERPVADIVDTPDPVAAAERAVEAERARAAEQEATPAEDTAAEDTATEIKTPAGTTAAAPGHNPDTTESDLHQPDTEPLMDPSLTKAIKSEAETMRKASDPGGE